MQTASVITRLADCRLETERLTIRRFRRSDLELAIAHESNPRIMKYIRDPMPPDELRKKVEGLAEAWKAEENEWLGLPVTLRGQEEMIGMLFARIVSFQNETAEIGYRFHHDHHGQGYAFEASRRVRDFLFDEVEVHKLTAMCVAENAPSYRLLEKLGMKREGRLREYSKLGGRWCDELLYGLLARERPDGIDSARS